MSVSDMAVQMADSPGGELVRKGCLGHVAPFARSDRAGAKLEAGYLESYSTLVKEKYDSFTAQGAVTPWSGAIQTRKDKFKYFGSMLSRSEGEDLTIGQHV
jgi:hypothetical protein